MSDRKEKKFKREDEVKVISYVQGQCFYKSPRSNQSWNWKDFGSVLYIPYGELMDLPNENPKYLSEPWLIVDDEIAVKQLGLVEFYSKILKPDQFNSFINEDPVKMISFLKETTSFARETLFNFIRKKIENKEFDSLIRIMAIEETFKVKLRNE